MVSIENIEHEARQLCRHTVCFADAESKLIVARAIQGRTTKAIATELRLTPSKVQYAILKAQRSLGTKVKFRRDYRNGTGTMAKQMLHATEKVALKMVSNRIAPKFASLAAPGVLRGY